MGYRRRDYPEVLETMLTSLAGGVSAEPHPYPPPGDSKFVLEQPPARTVVSVHGMRNGGSHRFKLGSDVALSLDGNTLTWAEGGDKPDPGTLVEVNYLRRDDPAQLTDYEVGGVARTIVQSVARETARLHAVMQGVYDAGFVESATGGSLDKVVALLGVERVPAGRAVAKLRFTRDPSVPGTITVAEGTRVIDAEAKVEYETTEPVTMSPAQNRIAVTARDVEPGNSPVGPGVLTVLPVPIGGIVEVTNPDPASRADNQETDAELRLRARSFLQGSEKATVGSLKAVLAKQGVSGEVVEGAPGMITVKPVSDALTPERFAQLNRALHEARPAGTKLTVAAPEQPGTVALSIKITSASGLAEPDRRAAHESVRNAITDYFDRLPLKDEARVNQIVGAALGVDGVEDFDILSATLTEAGATAATIDVSTGVLGLSGKAAMLGELSISDPALPTKVDLSIRFAKDKAVPDRNEVVAKIEAALDHLTKTAAADGEAGARTLSFGKLVHLLPAPIGAGAALSAITDTTSLPGDGGDYTVALFVAQANGLTRVLAKSGDAYEVDLSERLALNAVSIEVDG
ncbi:MAG: hypothetical protein AAGJ28_02470 [Pseudomonadota bacterium]